MLMRKAVARPMTSNRNINPYNWIFMNSQFGLLLDFILHLFYK